MYTKQIIFPVTTKQFLVFVCVSFIGLASLFSLFASDELTPREICEQDYVNQVAENKETNRNITQTCKNDFKEGIEIRKCLDKLLLPPINTCWDNDSWSGWIKELTLRDMFSLGNCRFVNAVHKLPKYNLEWVAYDIACEKGKSFEVRSPWQYKLSYKWYWTNLGNYIILEKVSNLNERIVLAHIVNDDEQNTVYNYYDVVGKTDVSWASTNYHIHIELWDGYWNVSREFLLWETYETMWTKLTSNDGTRLLNHRGWDFGQPEEAPPVYYFTAYNLWDPNQNDSSPCIWASWKDLCYLEKNGVRTMALTSDVRKMLWISFGESVRLTWDKGCEGIYQVEDEMNKRFRETPWVLRPWTNYYIKGDLPSKEGGACSITKL